MAEEDRHLTTEELSAYLDGQISAEERDRWHAHLSGCELCQQELASLRQTAALLRALPQPILPRSFVLPANITAMPEPLPARESRPTREPAPIGARSTVGASRSGGAQSSGGAQFTSPSRRNRWPVYVRGTLRTLSALAAVAGVLLFLSGLLTGITNTTGGMSTASSSAPHAMQPYRGPGVSSAQTPRVSNGKQAQGKAATPTPAMMITPQVQSANNRPVERVPSSSPPILPELLFFDVNTSSGRIGLGMLLFLLGVMGYIVFKRQRESSA